MTTSCRYCRADRSRDGGEWRPAWTDTDSDVDPFDCNGIPAIPGAHAPEPKRDEVLMAEVRDQYRDLGMDEDQIAEAVGAARDAGMFDYRD